MNSTNKTPVAFFAYNRPKHTALSLEALYACHRKEDFEFFFFSDGPRDINAISDVESVRLVLLNYAQRFSATVIEHDSNLGLARSIVQGVTRLCNSHGRIIVLEDDLIVAPDFLHYMVSALDYYQDYPIVMQVSGYTFVPPKDRDTDVFLLPVTTTWGWGTWARAWQYFSWEPHGWPATRNDIGWLSRFQLNGSYDYVTMLEERLDKRNNSWGILWWYAVSRCGGEVVYPLQSLVFNQGFDGSGVHCGIADSLGQQIAPTTAFPTIPASLSFPLDLTHDPLDLVSLESVLRKQKSLDFRLRKFIRLFLRQIRKGVNNAFS